jgi:hypothetical protein
MPAPNEELPNINEIRRLAQINLPKDYVIKDVRISYGEKDWTGVPQDFEIVVDYEDNSDPDIINSFEHIEAYQNWAHALEQDIRSEWPPESVRISFNGRSGKH